MVIDFDKIGKNSILNFKGGEGELITRNFVDDDNKIMFSILKPGASTGYHLHDGNCEIIYIVEGEATFNYDGETEIVKAGTYDAKVNRNINITGLESGADAVKDEVASAIVDSTI